MPRLPGMPAATTPIEPGLPASLEVLSADTLVRDGATFSAAELRGARWCGVHVSGLGVDESLLGRCDLSDAVLTDPEFTDAVLDELNMANALIRGGSLARVLVSGGRLTGTQFAETKIRDTVWRGVSADLSALRLVDLVRVTFDSCNLRQADFTGSQCDWVRFHDCDLSGAIFSRGRFTNSEFRRCRLEGIEGVESLRGASMELEAVLGLAADLADALGIRVLEG
jgi:uncharacterized protein YjbI with pentapeptide repeats